MTFSCTEIIEHLYLEPLPLEGGYFRRTYETAETIDLAKGYIQPVGSGIYFLLTPDSFSAFHWLIEDEVYHFYLGDPVELYELSPDEALRRTILGQDLEFGQQVQHTVFKNRWHGSRLQEGGKWALLGTTMSPGFSRQDFKLGEREQLIAEYPQQKNIILELTR